MRSNSKILTFESCFVTILCLYCCQFKAKHRSDLSLLLEDFGDFHDFHQTFSSGLQGSVYFDGKTHASCCHDRETHACHDDGVGSPGYCPPLLANRGSPIQIRSDFYLQPGTMVLLAVVYYSKEGLLTMKQIVAKPTRQSFCCW